MYVKTLQHLKAPPPQASPTSMEVAHAAPTIRSSSTTELARWQSRTSGLPPSASYTARAGTATPSTHATAPSATCSSAMPMWWPASTATMEIRHTFMIAASRTPASAGRTRAMMMGTSRRKQRAVPLARLVLRLVSRRAVRRDSYWLELSR